ncbi:hypothetical protein [Capybara microvirus Cap1_SP_240]|nr:hypothetical protein [Capybara microvirus Cap1_SP_240]
MIYFVYSIYDSVDKSYTPPQLYRSEDSAQRAFNHFVECNFIGKDCKLVCLGSWSDTDCKFCLLDPYEVYVSGEVKSDV